MPNGLPQDEEVGPEFDADDRAALAQEGHPRRWAILGVLITGLLVVVLDNTIMNVALKTIQEDLNATQGELVWAINAYILVFAAMLFTWGVLGDRYGRKRILVIGFIGFAIASALCGFSKTPDQLIAARALMGVFGASVMPVTLAIITVIFPPKERGRAIGIWAAAVGGAVALGPVLGGLLLEWFWWGSVFLVNVPIIILGLIGIFAIVPETKNPHPGKLDIIGLLLSITGLILVVYAIEHGGDTQEWLSPAVVGPFVAGVAILVLFVFQQAKSPHPSMDLSLFKIRSFTVSVAMLALVFGAMMGSFLFFTFYMQVVRGYSPLKAGVCTLPFAIGQVLAAPRSGKMVDRFGARVVVSVGITLTGLSFLAIAMFKPATPLWLVLLVFFIFGFGMGNVVAPATTRMTLAVPPAKAGAGSAMQNTLRQVGSSFGVAILSSIGAVAFKNAMIGHLNGLQVPPQAAAALEDSVGAAYEVIGRAVSQGLISPAQATVLQDNAVSSFMHSFTLVAITGAVMALVGLVFVLLWLPKDPEEAHWTSTHHETEDGTPDAVAQPVVD